MKHKRSGWLICLPIVTFMAVGLLFMFSSHNPRLFYSWGGIRESVKDTVINIADDGWVPEEFVGYAGRTPAQYHRRIWLRSMATVEELSRLTEYPDGTVKAIAYEGLLRRDSTRRFEILMQAIQDSTSFVYYQSGCHLDVSMLGEHLIQNVLQLNVGDFSMPPPVPDGSLVLSFSDQEMDEIERTYRELIRKKREYFERYME